MCPVVFWPLWWTLELSILRHRHRQVDGRVNRSCDKSDAPKACMATLQKPPADGGEGGCGAVCRAGEDLNSCAVRDTCEAGHTTTHAGGAEVVNMLCWCRVNARSPRLVPRECREPKATACRAAAYLAP